MRFHLSTDDVPERARFTFWAETLHGALGLEAQPLPDASGPFRGHLSGRSSGPLFNLRVDSAAHRVSGRPGGGARRPWYGYRIYHEASAGAWFKLTNMEGVTRTGDLVIYDADLPFETQPRDGYRLEMCIVPRALLGPHLPARGQPLAKVLSGRNGVHALAAGYLDALTRNWDSISEVEMDQVADTLARLIGIACGGAAEEQADAVRAGRLVEARRHIDRHLADSALSPASAAAALGISVRSLHLLFEPTGTSFAREVLRRRLEACRAALLADPTRTVTDIAFAWGFGNLSGFYRAFQAAFAMSPGELRAAGRGAQRS